MKKKDKQIALALAIIVIFAAAIAAYAIITAKPSTWQPVAQLSHTGIQNTTEFVMNNTWRIKWAITKQDDNLFVLAVSMKNATDDTGYSWVTEASETDTNATQGILPVPYTGTFAIRVLASDTTEWLLIIEEFKPA